MNRRTWLKLAASTAATAVFPLESLAQTPPDAAQPFSEDLLDAFARKLAAEPYKAPEKRVDDALADVTYEQYNKAIVYKSGEAIWRKDHGPFWLEMNHTAGAFYALPVEMFA